MNKQELPEFLNYCGCDGDNMEQVCFANKCSNYYDCEEFMKPLANELKRIMISNE